MLALSYPQAVFDFEWAQAEGKEQGMLNDEFPVLCKPQPKVGIVLFVPMTDYAFVGIKLLFVPSDYVFVSIKPLP